MKNIRDIIGFTIVLVLFLIFAIASTGKTNYRSYKIKVRATAYCPCSICCGNHSDGRTATGRNAYSAGVAVDPKQFPDGFPLGSYFDIPNYNRGPNENGSWIVADDTGRLIKGRKIDVRFRTHEEAIEWGVKDITVRVWVKE